MHAKRYLPTPLCAILLSSVALLALCADPVVTGTAISSAANANLRQHARTMTSTMRPDSTLREERAMAATVVTEESALTRLSNRISFWVMQTIGGSFIMRRLSPVRYMKVTRDREKSAFKLFQDFDLDEVPSQVFESPAFMAWSSIISKAFPDNPDLCAELKVSALVKHDEAKLIDSIATAKLYSEAMATVKELESALIDKWLSDPNEKLIDVLKKPMVQKWLGTLSTGDPAMETLLFKAYARKGFQEEATEFEAAAEAASGSVRAMAESILGIQRANDEFRKLELDKESSSKAIVNHERLGAWLKKVQDLGWDPVKLLFFKLKAVSSDQDILVACVSENHLPHGLRSKLQDVVFDQWVGLSDSAVLNNLGLDAAKVESLSTLLLPWAGYMRRRFPETASIEMVKVLRGFYQNNLVEVIARAEESNDKSMRALAKELAAAAKKLDSSNDLPQPDLPPPVAPLPEV